MTDTAEHFINHLLGQMTLEEKIGQLNQVHPGKEVNLDQVRQGSVGSLINASGALTGLGSSESVAAETTNLIQQAALESRLKLPVLFGRDVIHGYRTVFPIPLAQAAAFDPDVAEQAPGRRQEATPAASSGPSHQAGYHRDPRWGLWRRNGEIRTGSWHPERVSGNGAA
jgi:beta-glucosidase